MVSPRECGDPDPYGGHCSQGTASHGGGQLPESGEAVDQWELTQPGQRTGHQVVAAHRGSEEGADHDRVELGPGTIHQFLACSLGGQQALVRADRGHGLEGVRHRHDPTAQRNVLSGQSEGVAPAVVALVVLDDGVGPRSEPVGQWRGEPGSFQGMSLQESPFCGVGLARLVQDGRGHGELADVVEQGRPPEPVLVGLGQLEFVGDHVGEDADSFGVAPGQSVVPVERGSQGQDVLGGHRWFVELGSLLAALGQLALEGPGAPGPPGHGHPRGGMVREDHGHAQQGGQREGPTSQAVRQCVHQSGHSDDQHPPGQLADALVRHGHQLADHDGREDGHQDGGHQDAHADEERQPGSGAPMIRRRSRRSGAARPGPSPSHQTPAGRGRPRRAGMGLSSVTRCWVTSNSCSGLRLSTARVSWDRSTSSG